MKLSDCLRALAEEKNLTQKQIAKDLGLPASTIGGYFQGTSEPDLEMVKRLARFFDCSTDCLLGFNISPSFSHNENTLIHLYRIMTPEQQELFLSLAKTVVQLRSK